MTEEQLEQNVITEADFESVYRTGDVGGGTSVRFAKVPWDLEGPQPAIVELERQGGFHGTVLDAGCGYGDNARYLVARGYQVTGIDGAEAAIEQARERAQGDDVHPEFLVADATVLDNLNQRFDTVLDSALYHCLDTQQRRAYAAALVRVTNPGARLHLYCFADEGAGRFPPPFQVSRDDLRGNLGEHWDIESIELDHYATAFDRDSLAQVMEMGIDLGFAESFDPEQARFDENGRMWLPVWHLVARRR